MSSRVLAVRAVPAVLASCLVALLTPCEARPDGPLHVPFGRH